MTPRNYPCKQQELYTICKLGWKSCTQHLPDFAAFKAKYTPTFIQDRLNEIDTTAALPDEQTRTEKTEIYRIQLIESARICLDLFQHLKRYIFDAYPNPAIQKAKIDSAGQDYYEKAGKNNWDSVEGLLTNASNFIATNLNDLLANQNMPPTFQAKFDQAKTNFSQLHPLFLDSEETALQETQQKVTANNDIYAKLMAMFADGLALYKTDDAIAKQFIFTESLYLVSGVGIAGIKGYVTDAGTGLALDDVSITLTTTTNKSKTTLSDTDGHYALLQVAVGIYTLKVEKVGYLSYLLPNHEVKLGVTSTVNVQLSIDI